MNQHEKSEGVLDNSEIRQYIELARQYWGPDDRKASKRRSEAKLTKHSRQIE